MNYQIINSQFKYKVMENQTYLTFVLGREVFAVNVINVLEVLEQQQITPVPRAPEHILGIINFRGEILPVVNTRSKFKLPSQDDNYKNYVIVYILGEGEQRFSIAATADAVKDVIEVNPEEIKPVPEMGISYDTRYITGVIRRDEKFILLLNTEKLFLQSEVEAATNTTNTTNTNE